MIIHPDSDPERQPVELQEREPVELAWRRAEAAETMCRADHGDPSLCEKQETGVHPDRVATEVNSESRPDGKLDNAEYGLDRQKPGQLVTEPRPVPTPPASEDGPKVQQAVRDALANFIAEPITDVVVLGVRAVGAGGADATAELGVDRVGGWLTAIADPAKIPSAVAKKAAEHLTNYLLTPATGPIGIVVAISWETSQKH